jgi:hypothetical protein
LAWAAYVAAHPVMAEYRMERFDGQARAHEIRGYMSTPPLVDFQTSKKGTAG